MDLAKEERTLKLTGCPNCIILEKQLKDLQLRHDEFCHDVADDLEFVEEPKKAVRGN